MQYEIKSAEVPPGIYTVVFCGDAASTHPEYGPGIKFEFEIVGGKFAGKSVYRTGGRNPSPKNVLGKLLAALAGVKAEDGIKVNADDFRGRRYQAVVETAENGSTRVGTIVREPEPELIAVGNVTPAVPLPVSSGAGVPSEDIPFAADV